jgi:hypothetical protein
MSGRRRQTGTISDVKVSALGGNPVICVRRDCLPRRPRRDYGHGLAAG